MSKLLESNFRFLFVLAPGNLSKKGPNGWFSEQVEPFIRQLRAEGHTVSMSLSPNFRGIRVKTADAIYDPRLRAYVQFAIAQFKNSISCLRPKSGVRFSGIQLRRDWFSARANAIRHVIQKERADVVCGINLSETEFMSARDLGLQTIEFQHGHYTSAVCSKMFPNSKPDFFAHWFQWDSELLSSDGLSPIHVGLPYLSEISSIEVEEKVLLFALQKNKRDSLDSFGFVASQLFPFLDFDWRSNNLHPIARFHPAASWWKQAVAARQMRKLFPQVEFVTSWEMNLESLMSRARAVVTLDSSIWIESAVRGIPFFSVEHVSATDRAPRQIKNLISVAGQPLQIANELRNATRHAHLDLEGLKPEVKGLLERLKSSV